MSRQFSLALILTLHCNNEAEAQIIKESYSMSLQLEPEVSLLLRSFSFSKAHISPQGFNLGHQNLKKNAQNQFMKNESRMWNSTLVFGLAMSLESSHRSGMILILKASRFRSGSKLEGLDASWHYTCLVDQWNRNWTKLINSLIYFSVLSPHLISFHCLHLQHIWKSGILQEYNKSCN